MPQRSAEVTADSTMRLRVLRKQCGLTLKALAARADLTESYLSKLERAQSVPSISVALRLAEALDVEVGMLFGARDPDELVRVVRASERTALVQPGAASESGYEGIAVGVPGKAMLPFVVHPTATASGPLRVHGGDELAFVHAGSAILHLADREIALGAGDAAYFRGSVPHRLAAADGSRDVSVLIVISRDGADPADEIPTHV